MTLSTVNTADTDVPICPYCGREQQSLNLSAADDFEAIATCVACGRRFRVERDIEITYTTSEIEERPQPRVSPRGTPANPSEVEA